MAKLIGGAAHNHVMPFTAQTLYVFVENNSRAPKEIRKSGLRFLRCVYKRTRIVKNGEVLYRFVSGYYRA